MKKSYHSSAEPIAEAIATRVRLVCPGAAKVACMLACGIGFLPSDDRLDPTPAGGSKDRDKIATCRLSPTSRRGRRQSLRARGPNTTSVDSSPATIGQVGAITDRAELTPLPVLSPCPERYTLCCGA